ncbi:MAG: NEW3 domain-containing protein [Chloroflexota bacterium]|nr:NEW3 domain-containing protein [Chloroflexota bacterium]
MFAVARTTARLVAVLLVFALVAPVSALAQAGLELTTPYPAVEVAPGVSASFPLTLTADETTRADLAVEGLPDGWSATLRGGGNQVHSVIVRPDEPPDLTLEVRVPDDAAEGVQRVTVTATGGGETAELALDLDVVGGGGGEVQLTSDFPSLRGNADTTFRFTLSLVNETPQQLTFSLQGTGPAGWDVTVQPSGQETAASVTVDAGGRQSLTAEAVPPADVAAGTYSVVVDAVAGGGAQAAEVELGVEVTGRVALDLTTPDQRLNTTASAGGVQDFQVTLVNSGTAPLTNVALSGSGPTDWTVEFEPATIDTIPPGATTNATAHITPSSDAIAGDYVVTLRANTEGATPSLDIRVTVETPPIAGIIGLLLIAAVIGGLAWIFRRYGRR